MRLNSKAYVKTERIAEPNEPDVTRQPCQRVVRVPHRKLRMAESLNQAVELSLVVGLNNL